MRKIINNPDDFVDEVVEGILLAHPDRLGAVGGDLRVLARTDEAAGRVGIVTGGGSGHLPLFLGYVGRGLCSSVAIGNVFSSPSAEQMLAAIEAADEGAGVLCLYGNYGGDIFNFDLACDLADELHLVIAPLFVGTRKASRFVRDGQFPFNPDRRARLAGVEQIGDVVLLRYALSGRFSSA